VYRSVLELTATGIVPEFHRIPFSSIASDFKIRRQWNLTRYNVTVFKIGNQH
jgi:hypothetical protein